MARGVTRTVATPHPPVAGGHAGHGAHQRLADRDRVRLGEERLEAGPVLLVGERIGVAADRLIDVDPQRRVVGLGDRADLGEAVEVRTHHDGDERHRNPEPAAARRLPVQEIPVAGSALAVLLVPRRVIERELDILEGRHVRIVQDLDRVAVGGDRQLERLRPKIGQHGAELRVHSVLAGAEVHRANGQPLDHGAHLIEGEPVDPRRVPVAERAGQVALVREPDAERKLRGSLVDAAGRFDGEGC